MLSQPLAAAGHGHRDQAVAALQDQGVNHHADGHIRCEQGKPVLAGHKREWDVTHVTHLHEL